MKMISKFKTTPNLPWLQIGRWAKEEDKLKKEDYLNNEDNLKKEDDL